MIHQRENGVVTFFFSSLATTRTSLGQRTSANCVLNRRLICVCLTIENEPTKMSTTENVVFWNLVPLQRSCVPSIENMTNISLHYFLFIVHVNFRSSTKISKGLERAAAVYFSMIII